MNVLREVQVRLMRSDEEPLWHLPMREHHHLAFKRFAGCGQRQLVE